MKIEPQPATPLAEGARRINEWLEGSRAVIEWLRAQGADEDGVRLRMAAQELEAVAVAKAGAVAHFLPERRADMSPRMAALEAVGQCEGALDVAAHRLRCLASEAADANEAARFSIAARTLDVEASARVFEATELAAGRSVGFAEACHLKAMTGGLASLVEWLTLGAAYLQPNLALAVALGVVGACAGRRYQTRSGLQPAMFALGVARSGFGKGHPQAAARRLLQAAGLRFLDAGGDIASGAAVASTVQRKPVAMFLADEFGKLLAAIASDRAPGHKQEIATRLTELCTVGNGTYIGAVYANQAERPQIVVDNPVLAVVGMTQPSVLAAAVKHAAVADGTLPRFLMLSASDEPPTRQPAMPVPVPDELVELVQAIRRGADAWEHRSLMTEAPSDPASWPGAPYIVPQTAAADALETRLIDEQDALMRKPLHDGLSMDHQAPVAARLAENAVKAALCHAVCRDPAAPAIDAVDMQFGRAVARQSVEAMLALLADHVAESKAEANVQRIERLIRERGRVSASQFYRATRSLTQRERDEALASLQVSGLVAAETHASTGGRPKQTLVWVGPAR